LNTQSQEPIEFEEEIPETPVDTRRHDISAEPSTSSPPTTEVPTPPARPTVTSAGIPFPSLGTDDIVTTRAALVKAKKKVREEGEEEGVMEMGEEEEG
jgi:hypothetical protein